MGRGLESQKAREPPSSSVLIDPVLPCPQGGVAAVEKMWLGMGLELWPWTVSFMSAALCVTRAGPSFEASTSMLWRGGRTVRAAMW